MIHIYVDVKDILKIQEGNTWKSPMLMTASHEKQYVCQTECVVLLFNYEKQHQSGKRNSSQVFEAIASKTDREQEELFNHYVQKYVHLSSEAQ